jgi:hypothetical protein
MRRNAPATEDKRRGCENQDGEADGFGRGGYDKSVEADVVQVPTVGASGVGRVVEAEVIGAGAVGDRGVAGDFGVPGGVGAVDGEGAEGGDRGVRCRRNGVLGIGFSLRITKNMLEKM